VVPPVKGATAIEEESNWLGPLTGMGALSKDTNADEGLKSGVLRLGMDVVRGTVVVLGITSFSWGGGVLFIAGTIWDSICGRMMLSSTLAA